jgi:voltage-gated potassium channel Kch
MTEPRRTLVRSLARPASVVVAALAIVGVTSAIVLLGAAVMYAADEAEFGTYGQALWFTLQTATTVGYGDVTPTRIGGRIVAAAVMLVSLGMLTVLTATITSYFIRYATRAGIQRNQDELTSALARLDASVLALSERVDEVRDEIRRPGGAAELTPTGLAEGPVRAEPDSS